MASISNRYCPGCEKVRPASAWIDSPCMQTNGILPYCKSCIGDKIDAYTEILSGERAGMWVLCAEMGVPFMNDLWKKAERKVYNKNKNRKNIDNVIAYIDELRKAPMAFHGFWESDVMLDEILGTRAKEKEVAAQKKAIKEKDLGISVEDFEKKKKKWGNFTIDEVEFLENTFKDYTQYIEDMDTALEKRYRDLCKAELFKMRADATGDIKEIQNAQANVNGLLKLLKLDDFKSQAKTDAELHVEKIAWMMENTKPLESKELEAYKKWSGTESVWSHITRSLRNLIAGTREWGQIPKE